MTERQTRRPIGNIRPIWAKFQADATATISIPVWRASRCVFKLSGVDLPNGWKATIKDLKTGRTANATGRKKDFLLIPEELMLIPGRKRVTIKDSRGRYIGTIYFFYSRNFYFIYSLFSILIYSYINSQRGGLRKQTPSKKD